MTSEANLAVALAVGALALSIPYFGIHRVPEGHIAVYWRGGALLPYTAGPGFQTMLPVVTSFAAVQVTIQTDKVVDIPCGTAGGTLINFDRIEVVNQLSEAAAHAMVKNYTVDYDKTWIYDKIHHEINQFCSKHTLQEVYIDEFDSLDEALRDALQRDIDRYAPGISIIAIRVTKPRIPDGIRRNYEAIEAERTKLQVAAEAQKLVEKEAETERKRALIEAEKLAAVEAVTLQRKLAEKENAKAMATIENEMHLAQQRALADAEHYRTSKEAEANALRLTPEYLQLEAVRAVANNTKVFYGDKIPSMFVDAAALAPGTVRER